MSKVKTVRKKFDPMQPRDNNGRWVDVPEDNPHTEYKPIPYFGGDKLWEKGSFAYPRENWDKLKQMHRRKDYRPNMEIVDLPPDAPLVSTQPGFSSEVVGKYREDHCPTCACGDCRVPAGAAS